MEIMFVSEARSSELFHFRLSLLLTHNDVNSADFSNARRANNICPHMHEINTVMLINSAM